MNTNEIMRNGCFLKSRIVIKCIINICIMQNSLIISWEECDVKANFLGYDIHYVALLTQTILSQILSLMS